MKTITSIRISDDLRPYFLPMHFGRWMRSAENKIYDTLGYFCKEYKGAYWHFYELSNHGFYMAPDLDEDLNLFIESNGYEGNVSADAAGIIATLYTLNHLCNITESEKLIDAYYLLRDYAGEHAEASKIYSAID